MSCSHPARSCSTMSCSSRTFPLPTTINRWFPRRNARRNNWTISCVYAARLLKDRLLLSKMLSVMVLWISSHKLQKDTVCTFCQISRIIFSILTVFSLLPNAHRGVLYHIRSPIVLTSKRFFACFFSFSQNKKRTPATISRGPSIKLFRFR